MAKSAVLLVNLGSPDSTSVADVRRYLDEFLSDDRVLDKPKWLQQFVLRCFILPKRPQASAHAYQKVWLPEGSPLMVTSRKLQTLVQAQTDLRVALAMRYGNPSIPSVIAELVAAGTTDLFLVPLYPHYAMSSYETVVTRVFEVAQAAAPDLKITTLQPFFDEPQYIDALYESARPDLEGGFDYVLFSYHGIPERHLRKADSSRAHCLTVPDCCRVCSPVQSTCYRAQTVKTTEAFVQRAGLAPAQWSISYQSRLGREPWLKPYTDFELPRLAQAGVKRLLVMTPAFVSDCLETLEEIAMTGKETFLAAGGASFKQIPCLNEHPRWVRFLVDRIEAWRTTSPRRPAATTG